MRFLREHEVRKLRGDASRTSTYLSVRNGTLTRPIAIGPRSKAWPEHEVIELQRARLAGLDVEQLQAVVNALHAKRSDYTPPQQ